MADNISEEVVSSAELEIKTEENTQEDQPEEASLDTEMKASNETAEPNDTSSAPQEMNLDGANDMPQEPDGPALETRIPVKKDIALREFLSKMDDYAPIVSLLTASL